MKKNPSGIVFLLLLAMVADLVHWHYCCLLILLFACVGQKPSNYAYFFYFDEFPHLHFVVLWVILNKNESSNEPYYNVVHEISPLHFNYHLYFVIHNTESEKSGKSSRKTVANAKNFLFSII